MMMTHSVYFWLRGDLTESEAGCFESEILKLPGIEVVARGTVGKPAPTPERPVIDNSFSYHLHLEFAIVDDHNVYQDHPAHHRFVTECQNLWERVVVHDSLQLSP